MSYPAPSTAPGALVLEQVYYSDLTYGSSLHQAIQVAIEVGCENIQVKWVNECFQIVNHFLSSEEKTLG